MMGSVQTACRDPVFWRWHAQINDLFTSHKNSLKPYTEQEVGFLLVLIFRVWNGSFVPTQSIINFNMWATKKARLESEINPSLNVVVEI